MNGSGMSSQYESDLGEWAGDYQNLERDNPPMWRPRPLAFRPYVASSAAMSRDSASVGEGVHHRPLRVIVNKPHVIRLTKDITETYQICNPSFTYSDILNPTVYLTKPSTGVLNDGYDNANSDLIMAVSFLLVNSDANRRYIVLEMLGQGTFGQVVKCWSPETNNYVAVKVIKNQPAYYHQALVEISILAMLNRNYDPEDKHHIVRIIDHFVFQKHLCITFELLGVNLFELLKMNHYRGVSLKLLRLFAKQILDALLVLREASVIHCDLKPENILLTESVQSGEIKLIDFGSACMENRTVYSYIQSRFYRSPEVLLGHPYTTAIDMWSFGCIVAELFLGLPLFPGASEYDLIKRMIQILRDQPPDHILRTAKNTSKYFKLVGNSSQLGEKHSLDGHKSSYHFLTEAEYEAREMKKPASGKRYFNYDTLEEIIINYPYKRPMTEEELSKENETRLAFIDFVRGLVQFDPVKRWTPRQAVQHPFVTEEAFTCPFVPPSETPRTPVRQIVRVDHNPGAGHWFAAGLSPQVSNMNRAVHYTSPQYQQAAFPYGSSYGSIGSHGSYGDGFGLGSSYGSYGDMSNKFIGYCPLTPSGISMQNQGASAGSVLGASPDTRWRMPQVPHGHTLGISPSNSMLRPMSLGASPSQFTPPSSQMQVSTGSPIGSPGRYGPTSPARAGGHVSGLGKAAAVGQYKRRGFGMPGALHLSCQDNLSQHFQGAQKNFPSNCDSALNSGEGTSRIGYVGSPRGNQPNMHQQTWRQRCGSGMPSVSNSSVQHTVPGSNASSQHTVPISNASSSFAPHAMPGCNASTSTAQHIVSGSCLLPESDGTESNSPLPDPGDWDPNYSDDLLLQEDGSEIISPRYAGSGAMHFNQGTSSSSTLCPGAGRSGNNYAMSQAASSSNSNAHRSNGFVQGHSNLDGSSTSLHAMQPGYARSLSKPLHHGLHSSQQSTLSRLGQQPSQHSQLHYQHSHSMLHPDILSLPNTVGQMHAQQYPNEKSFVGGKGPLPFLCSPSKDSQPDCVHFPQRGTGPTTAMASGVVQHQSQASQWPAGMGHMHGQSSFTHELSWGQRAGHSLTTFSPPSYGKRDYRRAG